MFLRLAFRNVTRNWQRNALSLVSVVAGVAVIVLGRGFVAGFKENIVRAQIDTVSSHVLARPADYPTTSLQHPVDELLTVDADTQAWLDANTSGWTRRTMFAPRVIFGRDAMRVRAIGIDPTTDPKVFPRDQWAVDGCTLDEAGMSLVLSPGVSGILGAGIGDTVVLETRTAAGAINALNAPVCGITKTGNPGQDRIGILVPPDLLQALVRPGPATSHVLARLKSRDGASEVAAELQRRLGDSAETATWEDETRALVEAQEMRQAMLDIIAFVLLAMAATGIANTVLMAAYERVREIGTLRALGLTRRGVVSLFVTEGLVMGVAGSFLGAVASGAAMYHWAQVGIDMTPLMGEMEKSGAYDNIPVSTMLWVEFSPATLVGAAIFGVMIAVVASIYPALLASRMPPAEAVRA
jgi:ABC-type lipoprotein release transport system permease subunit